MGIRADRPARRKILAWSNRRARPGPRPGLWRSASASFLLRRKSVDVGWKSESRMMVGVTKIRIVSRVWSLVLLRNSEPMSRQVAQARHLGIGLGHHVVIQAAQDQGVTAGNGGLGGDDAAVKDGRGFDLAVQGAGGDFGVHAGDFRLDGDEDIGGSGDARDDGEFDADFVEDVFADLLFE